MKTEERLDELLAASLAHHAILEEIVEQVFPNPRSQDGRDEKRLRGV